MSDLKRILYTSRLAPAAASQLKSTMEDILIVSQRLNQRDAITGFLWSDGLTFAQVIEGPRRLMDNLYARIARDPRHHALKLHLDMAIEGRKFPRWSMCGMTLADLDDLLLGPMDVPHDIYDFGGDILLALLSRIAATYGARLDAAHRRLTAG